MTIWTKNQLSRWMAVLAAATLATGTVWAVDTDSDGMDDAYETRFGLDPQNAADATQDPDSDSLANQAECSAGTDPFTADTDRDGFGDSQDSTPISRAFLGFGTTRFTSGDAYSYAAPTWFTGARQAGGQWVTNSPTGWQATNSPATLTLDLAAPTNNLVLHVSLFDAADAALYLDLVDAASNTVATNVAGNLLTGTATEKSFVLGLPLGQYSNATAVVLRHGQGAVTVHFASLYRDADLDGLDTEQEAQLGTSDSDTDSDDDGLTDFDEVMVYHTDPLDADSDNDGLTDGAEVNTHHTDPLDADSDNDGLTDGAEVNTYATNPLSPDTDADGMGDLWEVTYGFDPAGAPTNSLLGWWTLDESSGNPADASGHGLTAATGTTSVPGVLGNARQFGGNDVLAVAPAGITPAGGFTLSAYVNFGSLYGSTGRMDLVARPNAAGGAAFGLYKTASHELAFELNDGQSNVLVVKSESCMVVTGRWYHVAGSWNGTLARLYVDGVAVSEGAFSQSLSYSTTQGLQLGGGVGSSAGPLLGALDDVRVYTGSLNAQDVADLARAGADGDWDGLRNVQESAANTAPDQADTDGDGLTDAQETGTNPGLADTDADGLPDGWEVLHGLNPAVADASTDPDADGLSNLAEYQNGTDPQVSDTDGDGLSDGAEVNTRNTDPLKTDTDNDGLSDGVEVNTHGTNPLSGDTDGDGMPDKWELDNGLNPLSAADALFDPDNDGLNNLGEYQNRSNRLQADTDGDGLNDGAEVNTWHTNPLDWDSDYDNISDEEEAVDYGTNPLNADSDGDGLSDAQELFETETNPLAADADQDGLNDGEELSAGTSTTDADSDNDGLTDGAEVHTHHSNPLSADSDGDGLADAAEVNTHGTDPSSADTDHDGLNDRLEIELYGTPADDADADDDGISDAEEVLEAHTDPFEAEFNGTVTTEASVNGAQTNAAAGEWKVVGTEIESGNRRGYVEYKLTTTGSDVYRLTAEATHVFMRSSCMPVAPISESPVSLTVDGLALGKRTLVAADGTYGLVLAHTPWLTAGEHTVRVAWENVHDRVALRIKSVKLERLGGADANSNGVKDWIEVSLRNAYTLAAPASSVVSPLCAEGDARFPSLVAISNATAHPSASKRWYADVALNASGATTVQGTFEGGALSRSTSVTWVAHNLLVDSNLTIRVGDSVKFTAVPSGQTSGTVQVQISGGTNYTFNVGDVAVHPFTAAGSYTVNGIWEGSQSRSVNVKVLGGSFPTNVPACLLGVERYWACPDLSSEAVLDADSTVAAERVDGNVRITMNNISDEHCLLARAGTNGPVIASTRLDGFWIQGAVDNYMWVREVYEDSQVWEQRMVVKNLPTSVRLDVQIFIAGVLFADDLTTQRNLIVSDFDALGEYTFRMIHPNSVLASTCHTIYLYQGTEYLGECYFAGTMPQE